MTVEDREVLERVEEEVRRCHRCPLGALRDSSGYMAVPGEGDLTSPVMFIGEAPGEEEALQGRPFVGRAGKLLTELLNSINLRRERVYITNILKCRPPGNRDPEDSEASACIGYLHAQISLLRPKIICLLGNIAIRHLLGPRFSLSEHKGKLLQRGGIFFLPCYHPAAVLRNPRLRTNLLMDFQRLRNLLLQVAPEWFANSSSL